MGAIRMPCPSEIWATLRPVRLAPPLDRESRCTALTGLSSRGSMQSRVDQRFATDPGLPASQLGRDSAFSLEA